MEKLTFKELSKKILEEEKRPLTAEEIWEIALQKGYDKHCGSQGKTPWSTITALIYVDMRDNPDSPFIKIDSKPIKFFLKNLIPADDLKKIVEEEEGKIEAPKELNYSERDLHPFLIYFAYYYMRNTDINELYKVSAAKIKEG